MLFLVIYLDFGLYNDFTNDLRIVRRTSRDLLLSKVVLWFLSEKRGLTYRGTAISRLASFLTASRYDRRYHNRFPALYASYALILS